MHKVGRTEKKKRLQKKQTPMIKSIVFGEPTNTNTEHSLKLSGLSGSLPERAPPSTKLCLRRPQSLANVTAGG